jgi:NTP pyrophosphatase (non-canonical NTP hydrolase)
VESIGLIAEAFQWDTDGTDPVISRPKHAHLCNQLSKIINVVRTLAQIHKISLAEAFNKKMYKNREKYPISKSKGTFVKYDEHLKEMPNPPDGNVDSGHKYSTVSTINDASIAMMLFVKERDWHKYHKSPRNLTLALFGEIGEVIELFITKKGNEFNQRLGDELSDCLAYTVRLASCCDVNLTDAMSHYFPY